MTTMTMRRAYRLIDGEVRACSFDEGLAAMNDPRRALRRSRVGAYAVSTMFLVFARREDDARRPHLFETLVFDDNQQVRMRARCDNYEAALMQHNDAVRQLRALQPAVNSMAFGALCPAA